MRLDYDILIAGLYICLVVYERDFINLLTNDCCSICKQRQLKMINTSRNRIKCNKTTIFIAYQMAPLSFLRPCIIFIW